MDDKHYKRVLQGYKNKYNGQHFEEMITASCHHYFSAGVALIIKTPEPMKPMRDLGGGKFIAYYEKHAQPDYKGTLKGGQTIIFEAKHTETDRLEQKAVTEAQSVSFDYHTNFGAECFVVISFGFREFYKVPWAVFKDMKNLFGRKYIKPEDIKQYRVPFTGGVIKFLG